MRISTNPRRVCPIVVALLFGMLLTPAGLAAKDGKPKSEAYYKEVWAKLEAAVAAGKLGKDDAIKKMEAIKKAGFAK